MPRCLRGCNLGRLKFLASYVIEGTVLDPRGQALPGARVGWASGPPGVALPDVMALADAAGRFVLSAPAPGAYVVAAYSDTGQAQLAVQLGKLRPTRVVLQLR
jgi:Carboxypeptidase regulatory-like domain